MKKYIHYKIDLLAGLLSFNAFSACVHTRPTLGMESEQNDNTAQGSSERLVTGVVTRDGIAVNDRMGLDNKTLESLKFHNFSQESIKDCLALGVDINAEDSQGLTLLMYAVIYKNEPAVQFLADEGADVNIQNKCKDESLSTEGDTALHIAARRGLLGIVEILLKLKDKINVNIQNSHEDTPLHLAAHYMHLDVIQCLFQKGPDDIKAHLKNRDGNTFLSLAEKNGIQINDKYEVSKA